MTGDGAGRPGVALVSIHTHAPYRLRAGYARGPNSLGALHAVHYLSRRLTGAAAALTQKQENWSGLTVLGVAGVRTFGSIDKTLVGQFRPIPLLSSLKRYRATIQSSIVSSAGHTSAGE